VTGDLPLVRLSPDSDPTATPEPVASRSDGQGDPFVRALQLALVTAALLGVAGGTGLYLTRGSR
jgi:hypothetical protein